MYEYLAVVVRMGQIAPALGQNKSAGVVYRYVIKIFQPYCSVHKNLRSAAICRHMLSFETLAEFAEMRVSRESVRAASFFVHANLCLITNETIFPNLKY